MIEGKWRDLLFSTVILTEVSLGLSTNHTAHAAATTSPQTATQTQSSDDPSNISTTAPDTGKVAPATPNGTANPSPSADSVQDTTVTAADQTEQPATNEEAATNVATTPATDPAPADKTVSGSTPTASAATATTQTTVPDVQPGDDFGDTHQVAVTNVKDYQATSNQAIDWHNYHYIAAPGLTEDSPLGYQVKQVCGHVQSRHGYRAPGAHKRRDRPRRHHPAKRS